MKKTSLVLIAALVAAFSVAGAVDAHPGKPRPSKISLAAHKGFHGTVAAVGTDSITLDLRKGGTLTLEVTSNTRIRVNGARATLADVKVGYLAVVSRAKDGTARAIVAKEAGFKPVVHGVIEAVGSDSITLKLRKSGDSLAIPVTSDTKIHLKCTGKSSLSDLQVGYRAYVRRNGDGSARRIQAVQPHYKCVVHGTVSAVGTDSLTLTHPRTGFSLTVPVTADTKIYVNGAEATLADIQMGYIATVKRNDDGTARRINAHAPE